MDLSFSAIPQIRISSAYSPSSQCLTSSRREFFGSGNQPWLQGLRYRTILGKLGFHIETARCATFLDSVFESSILVMSATAAAFIAVPLAILDSEGRKNGKNKCSEMENSDVLARGEWHENTNSAKNQCTWKQLSRTEAISRKPCNDEGMTVVSRVPLIISSMKDDTLVSKDREMLNYHKALSYQNVSRNELHIVQMFALFQIINMLSKNGFDESNACLIVGKIKSTIRNSHVFDKKDFISGKRGKVLVYSYLQSFRPPPISSFFVISLRRKATVDSKSYYHWGHQHIAGRNEIPVTGYNGIYDRSAKENTYYCTEQIAKRSLTCFYGISKKPLSLSFQSKSEYCDTRHSLKRVLALQKNSSKYTERRVLVTCNKQTSSTKDNGIENGPSSTSDIGKTTMLKTASHLSGSLQPNGSVVKDSSNLENFLKIYDCLLKDARLKDCIDLLEIMERKGLLDMDKVHHTRFLNACKSQKAVKEAFCFCKLIKNPRLSTFNMLLSVCANAQDFDGAFEVMLLMKEAGLKPDCKLYTTLISTCGKCGKVDAMFEVFHEMVNAGVDPNVNTYGALIDGCARAGQVAKAFGVYGIMRSKNVPPDRVVFNALITACGRSGAVDRAFDVLAEMRSEPTSIDPDEFTIGALVKTCIQCGQAQRAREVYKMLHLYNIKGTPDVYTIAVNSCSQNGDLEFALKIYDDMKQNGVEPDEMGMKMLKTCLFVEGQGGSAR
ncbi:hypothetical protein HPP92_021799 [Vanilla planifolia]|uniref:PROP1-like PPR domain-containing protein n=1 Tax=Vanilla planifolia TaxID=51239 RepID=A0A835PUJ0_VANPL|nr:hypothetical protein HPP92_021799 [Vanilla planifolia]